MNRTIVNPDFSRLLDENRMIEKFVKYILGS